MAGFVEFGPLFVRSTAAGIEAAPKMGEGI